jgi:BirA family transcriptional regulator, biotin operon repressor / biotin---[acetyl-CoA-carboxylase] ligase
MTAAVASDLDPQRLTAVLRTQRYGRSLRVLSMTGSTNDDAKQDAAQGAVDGHVVLADAQRDGRGSQGRAWASPAGTDLYLSIVARPNLPLASLPPLTLAVGLGVAEAAELLLGDSACRAEVKWPNDVWLGGKKCAGILVETSSAANAAGPEAAVPVVIGIGLNVNRLQWPEELRDLATSLRAAAPGGRAFDRAQVLAALLSSVERWVDRLVREGPAAVTRALDARLAMRGARVRCGDVEGVLLGVAENGALRIATERGPREVLAGRIARLG